MGTVEIASNGDEFKVWGNKNLTKLIHLHDLFSNYQYQDRYKEIEELHTQVKKIKLGCF